MNQTISINTIKIGAFEAKTHLSELLEKVADGQSFIITKHGQAVAELKPTQTASEQKIAALQGLQQIRKMQSKVHAVTPEEIKAMINAGRKY